MHERVEQGAVICVAFCKFYMNTLTKCVTHSLAV